MHGSVVALSYERLASYLLQSSLISPFLNVERDTAVRQFVSERDRSFDGWLIVDTARVRRKTVAQPFYLLCPHFTSQFCHTDLIL